MKRIFVTFAVVFVLSGCAVGNVQVNPTSAALCGFHAWRLSHDVRTHHLGWAGFQAWRSIHHCRRVIR